jgi:SSS family solute:Na+ symporter
MALDIIVVLIYAAGMLALGWYGMRRAKTHEDYLVAGRNLGPVLYMGTMATTVLGGASTVGTVRLGYVHGISGFWLCRAGPGHHRAEPVPRQTAAAPEDLHRHPGAGAPLQPHGAPGQRGIMLAYALMIGVTSTLAMATVLQVLLDLPFWLRCCSAVAW